MDKIKISGEFNMNVFKIINNKKHLIETYSDKNLVVDHGKQSIIKLLANDGITNYISQIAFGEGTVDPAAGDIDLTNKYIKNILGYSYSGMNTIIFNWELLAIEGNGLIITEYGLFSNGDMLFARKVRSAIEKEIDIIFEGTWRISFITCP